MTEDDGIFDSETSVTTNSTDESSVLKINHLFDVKDIQNLVSHSPDVKTAIDSIINKCWYTDEFLLVNLQVNANQAIYQEYLNENLGQGFVAVSVEADVMMTLDNLWDEIAESCAEINIETYESDQQFLSAFVNSLHSQGKEFLIHIQNAHVLGEGVLEGLISSIEGFGESVVPHLLLWGEMAHKLSLLERVDEESDSAITFIDVPEFSNDDIFKYLHGKWVRVSSERLPLSAEDIADISEDSEGVAYEIDRLANIALLKVPHLSELLVAQEEDENPKSGLPVLHIASAAILLLVLIGIFYFDQDDQKVDDGFEVEQPVITVESVPVSAPDEIEAVVRGNPQLNFEIEQEEAANELIEEPAVDHLEAVQEPVVVEPELEIIANEISENSQNMAEFSGTLSLNDYEDSEFFIQLFGTYEVNTADEYINDNAIDQRFYYFETELDGRPWYVVVHGSFHSYESAESARNALPAGLLANGPWIRSMENIRNAAVK